MLKTAGIRRMGFLMLGGPGEIKETVEQSPAFGYSLDLELLKVTLGIRIYPNTLLAASAVADVMPDDDLLYPRFYKVPELNDWIHEKVRQWKDVPSSEFRAQS